jgi:non-canonical poly(A) RNA polymerase PAPD5/7
MVFGRKKAGSQAPDGEKKGLGLRLGKKKSRSKKKKSVERELTEKNSFEPLEKVEDKPEDGFISLDIGEEDVADDNASILTSRFKEYEEEFEQNQSDDDDYGEVPATTGKRKREEEQNGGEGKKMRMSEIPWLRDHSATSNMADWLTKEIRDFVAYVSPVEAEIVARNEAMRRIRELVHELWDDAETHVFGSYATDLYLPGSDIDMVILSDSGRYDRRDYLYQLSSKLRSRGIAKRVETIAKARVPIIKMVEAQTNIHIDISFEKRNGIKTVNTINSWKEMFPDIRCFILVVKQFLARRRLNEVHTGGLGGFSIICMVVSFLKNHPRVASGELSVSENLGVLLIEFFELYGKKFNYDDVGLCMTGRMGYLPKRSNPHLQNKKPFALAIEDPNDDTNNISRGSFNIAAIKRAFGGAFDILTARCFDLEEVPYGRRRGKTILGHLVQLKGPARDFEDSTGLVRNEYADVLVPKTSVESFPPAGKKDKGKNDDKPKVMYVSDNESSDGEEQEPDNNVVVISSDEENDSRSSRIQSVDKQTKRDFWLSKGSISA